MSVRGCRLVQHPTPTPNITCRVQSHVQQITQGVKQYQKPGPAPRVGCGNFGVHNMATSCRMIEQTPIRPRPLFIARARAFSRTLSLFGLAALQLQLAFTQAVCQPLPAPAPILPVGHHPSPCSHTSYATQDKKKEEEEKQREMALMYAQTIKQPKVPPGEHAKMR